MLYSLQDVKVNVICTKNCSVWEQRRAGSMTQLVNGTSWRLIVARTNSALRSAATGHGAAVTSSAPTASTHVGDTLSHTDSFPESLTNLRICNREEELVTSTTQSNNMKHVERQSPTYTLILT